MVYEYYIIFHILQFPYHYQSPIILVFIISYDYHTLSHYPIIIQKIVVSIHGQSARYPVKKSKNDKFLAGER